MTRTFTLRLHLTALLCASAFLVGCAGNGPPASDSSSSFDTIQRTIFDVHCLSAGCHNSTDRGGNLVLDATAAYANLINVIPFNAVARTNGLQRVVPGDAEHSFLLIKLTGPAPGEAARMPLTAQALSDADIALVRDWILAGAPGSGVPTATSSWTPSPTGTATPPNTATPSASATFTDTPTITTTPTITPTGTRPATPTPTVTQPPMASATTTATPSATATATVTASPSPMATPTFSLASTLPQIQATIFNATCLGLGCHNASDQGGGLVMEASATYANLVGVTPLNFAASQAGVLRVDPGNPANSFLLTKLTLPTVFDLQLGSRMPLAKPTLTAAQIESIRAWILRGALSDESPPASQ